ncbi:MAG: ATP-binding cassette domain-containing protein [Spirochaetales bacterium]|nr:ATP-binding cassette domain-containing protein [Spirochaetales bacterium]
MDALALVGIHKSFPDTGTVALSGADLRVARGEIHALVGENGAGKSTLARIACGMLAPDRGGIEVRGSAVAFRSRRDAERAGIGLVPQYSMLAEGLTVAQNISLGHEPRRLGLFYDSRRAEYEAAMLAQRYGFSVPADAVVAALGPSQRREAEILRAMARGADILVLDEPTSILDESETRTLFDLLRRLRAAGAAIVYISHRAREILDLADRVTVLRDGVALTTLAAGQLDECGLAELIAPTGACASGRDGASAPGQPVLQFLGAEAGPLGPVDLVVRSGEIVGVAAFAGNAMDTLEDLSAGVRLPDRGTVAAFGLSMDRLRRRGHRIAYIPTDREGRGMSLRSSLRDNVLAGRLSGYSPVEYAARKTPHADALALAKSMDVQGHMAAPAEALSGGNRQRLVLARELDKRPELVVVANPSQGLDPAARSKALGAIRKARDQGAAVLVLSQDPDDIRDLADRAFVLYRGKLKPIDSEEAGGLSALLTGART